MRLILLKAGKLRRLDLLFLGLLICLLAISISLWQERVAQGAILAMAPVLNNRVIVIDPGHGGIDPGVIGKNGTREKDITLEVAKRLGLVLSQSGAAVILTRDTDTDLSDPDLKGLLAKKRQDLKRRTDIANERKADVYIGIHVNSFPAAKYSGAQTFYQSGQKGGKILAEAIQAELRRVLQNTSRVAKGMDFYTNRATVMPSTTVEIGFMSNPVEEQMMLDSEYQNKIVWGIFVGLVSYFGSEQVESPSRVEQVTPSSNMGGDQVEGSQGVGVEVNVSEPPSP